MSNSEPHYPPETPTEIRESGLPPHVLEAIRRWVRDDAILQLVTRALEDREASLMHSVIVFPSITVGKERSISIGGGSMRFQTFLATAAVFVITWWALPSEVRGPVAAWAAGYLPPAPIEAMIPSPPPSGGVVGPAPFAEPVPAL